MPKQKYLNAAIFLSNTPTKTNIDRVCFGCLIEIPLRETFYYMTNPNAKQYNICENCQKVITSVIVPFPFARGFVNNHLGRTTKIKNLGTEILKYPKLQMKLVKNEGIYKVFHKDEVKFEHKDLTIATAKYLEIQLVMKNSQNS